MAPGADRVGPLGCVCCRAGRSRGGSALQSGAQPGRAEPAPLRGTVEAVSLAALANLQPDGVWQAADSLSPQSRASSVHGRPYLTMTTCAGSLRGPKGRGPAIPIAPDGAA